MKKGRTVRLKVYKFNELKDDAKKKAIQWFESAGGNVDNEWYDAVYEDAEQAGIKITGFDLGRSNYCNGTFIEDALYTAHEILKNHGVECETYKTAEAFIKERDEIVDTAPKDENGEWEDVGTLDEKLDECEEEFRESILEDYRIILSNEYDYLISEEQIIESIVANGYEFTADGKKF